MKKVVALSMLALSNIACADVQLIMSLTIGNQEQRFEQVTSDSVLLGLGQIPAEQTNDSSTPAADVLLRISPCPIGDEVEINVDIAILSDEGGFIPLAHTEQKVAWGQEAEFSCPELPVKLTVCAFPVEDTQESAQPVPAE